MGGAMSQKAAIRHSGSLRLRWSCRKVRTLGNLTHSQNANIICGMIKGQDILMLAVLMGEGAHELPYSELGRAAFLSVSEAHAAVKRLQESALINSMRRPVIKRA